MKGVNDVTSSRPYGNEARHLDVLMYISSLLAGQITYVRANTYVSGATRHPYTWPTFIPARVVSSLDQLVSLTLLALDDKLFHCCRIRIDNYNCIALSWYFEEQLSSYFIVVESGVIIMIVYFIVVELGVM